MLGWLSTQMPFRTAAILMSGIYLVGMGALLWAPGNQRQTAAGRLTKQTGRRPSF